MMTPRILEFQVRVLFQSCRVTLCASVYCSVDMFVVVISPFRFDSFKKYKLFCSSNWLICLISGSASHLLLLSLGFRVSRGFPFLCHCS